MVAGPRDYTSGTRAALFHLAQGTCYFPGCDTRVIGYVEGHPVVDVAIAHIRGAHPGSARFDEAMTDAERAAFDNLILLCNKHHKLVDTIEPEKYPVDTLLTWKRASEPTDGLDSLRAVDFSNIENLLQQIAGQVVPVRRVEVELAVGVFINAREGVTMPLDAFSTFSTLNSHIAAQRRFIVATVRNTGTLAVSVEAIDFQYSIYQSGRSVSGDFSLMGRNDFPDLNPSLPHRLADGDSMNWLMRHETAIQVESAGADLRIGEIWARVRLGSGEKTESERVPWPVAGGTDPSDPDSE